MTATDARLRFILGLDRLKAVERRSRPVGLARQENSAEHSWHAALAALLLVDECAFAVDAKQAALMLLMHDVPEILNGDTFAYSAAQDTAALAERSALLSLLGGLPSADANTLRDLWDEFEAGETPAARYANAIDRILPVMQNVAADGFSWRAHGVRLEQVLSRNAIVGEVLPNVWASVRPQIEAVFAAMNGLRDES